MLRRRRTFDEIFFIFPRKHATYIKNKRHYNEFLENVYTDLPADCFFEIRVTGYECWRRELKNEKKEGKKERIGFFLVEFMTFAIFVSVPRV